ncbi:unnamed protein product [Durusdinium trenchii]|uniref:TFIIH C1-like domain-containing protein n=1 Tax=Durusdinium trenchii TaxID=1381693 RepID=A0ABP0ILU0_9DINO
MQLETVPVDDIAEEVDAAAQDREQLRQARALEARWRWESLLEDAPPAQLEEKPASIAPPAEQLREASQGVQARRGVIRFLYLVVDLAEAALRERRWELLVQQSSQFAERFVTENPLSELGLLALRDASCEALAPLGTAFTAAKLNAIAKEAKGRCCAVAALQRALQGLQDVPSYGVREVLILLASVATCNLQELAMEDLLPTLRLKNIRVSVVSLSPEIFVLKNLCVETGGRFDVALNKAHFEELLLRHLVAPKIDGKDVAPQMVRMGFPRQLEAEARKPEACCCHCQVQNSLYICPQCNGRSCGLPSRCKICDLPLVSASVLARAFRSVVPLAPFASVAMGLASRCKACHRFMDSLGARCGTCQQVFCQTCDSFIHQVLRQCPGCLERTPLDDQRNKSCLHCTRQGSV